MKIEGVNKVTLNFFGFWKEEKKESLVFINFFPCTNFIVQAISMPERSAESVVIQLFVSAK